MIIKSLECTGFDVLIICFLKSFENYYVEMPTDKEYFRKRWQAAKVNFNLSYGMFDDDKLVGFIINAIVNDRGTLKAYNVGTGVLPEYRGRKIVRSIYNYALRDLKRDGIKNCSLEVIKDNIIAIKAYRSIGFEIVKNYKCYAGAIKSYFTEYIDLRETNYTNIACKRLPNQELYTWDN